MSTIPDSEYELVYLNPDGTWCDNPLSADWDAEPFWLNTKYNYVLPGIYR